MRTYLRMVLCGATCFLLSINIANANISFGKLIDPIDAVGISDLTGDGVNEVGVLYRAPNGRVKVLIKDGATKRKYALLDFGNKIRAISLFYAGDGDDDGIHELGVLGVEASGMSKVYFKNLNETGVGYNGFVISSNVAQYGDDYNQVCLDEFGTDWGIADWSDLKSFYNAGGNLNMLVEETGLTSAFIRRDGDQSYSGTRDYYASFHNHSKPSHYQAHDNLNNYFISLGSWYSPQHVFCSQN